MPAEPQVACPACDALSLMHADADEICGVCGWEDDAAQRAAPAAAQPPNGISLEEARANVARFGVAFPPSEAGGS